MLSFIYRVIHSTSCLYNWFKYWAFIIPLSACTVLCLLDIAYLHITTLSSVKLLNNHPYVFDFIMFISPFFIYRIFHLFNNKGCCGIFVLLLLLLSCSLLLSLAFSEISIKFLGDIFIFTWWICGTESTQAHRECCCKCMILSPSECVWNLCRAISQKFLLSGWLSSYTNVFLCEQAGCLSVTTIPILFITKKKKSSVFQPPDAGGSQCYKSVVDRTVKLAHSLTSCIILLRMSSLRLSA